MRLVESPHRQGKSAAISRAATNARGDILVFSDANNVYGSGAISALVSSFADERVGAVIGAKQTPGDGIAGESAYWRYEHRIRAAESAVGCCIGVNGEILAVRASLFSAIPDEIINDDFWTAMQVMRAGSDVRYAPDAVSIEAPTLDFREDAIRRRRMAAGQWQALARCERDPATAQAPGLVADHLPQGLSSPRPLCVPRRRCGCDARRHPPAWPARSPIAGNAMGRRDRRSDGRPFCNGHRRRAPLVCRPTRAVQSAAPIVPVGRQSLAARGGAGLVVGSSLGEVGSDRSLPRSGSRCADPEVAGRVKDRVRLVVLTNGYHPRLGGIERQLSLLLPRIADRGVEIAVYTRRDPGTESRSILDGVPVHRFPVLAGRGGAAVSFAAGSLVGLRRFDPHVVHAHEFFSCTTVGAIAKRVWATPLVVTPHADDLARLHEQRIGPWRWRSMRRGADRFGLISRDHDDELAAWGVPSWQRTVIGAAVDDGHFVPATPDAQQASRLALGLANGDPVAVFTGRISEEKRIDLLLDAWPSVIRAYPGATLVIVGDGGELEPLRRRQVPGCRFIGRVDDVLAYLQAADVYVHASRMEGFSTSILEAMSVGLPVVAAPAPGVAEAVGTTDAGIVLDGWESEPLAQAVTALFGDRDRRRALGARGRQTARDRHGADAIAAAWVSLYQELAGSTAYAADGVGRTGDEGVAGRGQPAARRRADRHRHARPHGGVRPDARRPPRGPEPRCARGEPIDRRPRRPRCHRASSPAVPFSCADRPPRP